MNESVLSLNEIGALASIAGVALTLTIYLLRERPEFFERISIGTSEHPSDFEQFWQDFLSEPHHFVISQEDVSENQHGTHVKDIRAAAELKEKLEDSFEEASCEFIESGNVSGLQKRKNLVLFGGPESNDLTEEVFEESDIQYTFLVRGGKYRQTIVDLDDPSTAFSFEYEDGEPARDVGLISRLENPYDDQREREVIVICGGYGWGTLAGSRVLMDDESLEYLDEHVGEHFQAVVTVGIDGDGDALKSWLVDLHPEKDYRRRTAVTIE